jgi:hypothetical protein
MLEKALGLDILWNEQKIDEIWNLDCEDSLYIWVTEVSYKRIFNFIHFTLLSLYHYNYLINLLYLALHHNMGVEHGILVLAETFLLILFVPTSNYLS